MWRERAAPWRRRALTLALLARSCAAAAEFPVIGIMSHPCKEPVSESLTPALPAACEVRCEYLAASYVKFVELAGARAVPISYYASADQIDELLPRLNGVLLPGGEPELPDAARRIVQRALELKDFPVWGTCLGFEWIADAVAEEKVIMEGFDAENFSQALRMEDAARRSSRLFHDTWFRDTMASNEVAFNSHVQGLDVSTFNDNEKLRRNFRLLSTNEDRNGRSFVSSMEAIDAPIYAVQYHPEKNIFEWGRDPGGGAHQAIPHSAVAVRASQAHANFFVEEARRNGNVYDLQLEDSFFESLPTYTHYAKSFVQVYLPCSGSAAQRPRTDVGIVAALACASFVVLAALCLAWRRRPPFWRKALVEGTSLRLVAGEAGSSP